MGPALSNWLEPCKPALPVRFGFVFESRERCKMQEDERDLLEVLIFDEIEEIVGTWLRTIIRRLEKEQLFEGINKSSQPQVTRR